MARKLYSKSQMDDAKHEATVAARHAQIVRSGRKMQEYVDKIKDLETRLAEALDPNAAQIRVVAAEAIIRAQEKALDNAREEIANLRGELTQKDQLITEFEQTISELRVENDHAIAEMDHLRSGRA